MKKTIIIAEAGVNHNGDLYTALEMVKVAKECGVDIVKFQTAVPEEVMIADAPKAEYQKSSGVVSETQLEMAKRIHLPLDAFYEIKEYCAKLGIQFLTTAFDPISLKFVQNLNSEYIKIPSGEITNFPYLRDVGIQNKKVLLSTGNANLGEIESALKTLVRFGTNRNNVVILHCTTEYPAPVNEVNLKAMLTLKNAFKLEVGLSDHTLGYEISLAAVALGATVIEKHFTLDKNMAGPDHSASLSPSELFSMTSDIRNIEISFGNGIKMPGHAESKNLDIVRKSIVAKKRINKGDIFSEDNITTKRPGIGLNPMLWEEIIGQVSTLDYEPDELIKR